MDATNQRGQDGPANCIWQQGWRFVCLCARLAAGSFANLHPAASQARVNSYQGNIVKETIPRKAGVVLRRSSANVIAWFW